MSQASPASPASSDRLPPTAGAGDWSAPATEPVAEGVFRIPLPMPGDALRAVNVYALEERDGLTLVDGGWARPEARAQLDVALGTIGFRARHIKRVLVTHAHRDHYTLAVVLRREFGLTVALGSGERESIAALTTTDSQLAYGSQLELLRGAGADELARRVEQEAVRFDPRAVGWEAPDVWLDAGPIGVGDAELTVVPTPGHTRGHLVFADLGRSLLFAGDHVLPEITPSIGLETVASPSPLTSFLSSLALVRALPDLRLLPAHGPLAPSSHARVDQLIAHHDERLSATARATADGEHTAATIAGRLLWTRRGSSFKDLDQFNQMLAIGETIAHLKVLVLAGAVSVRTDSGVHYYRDLVGGPASASSA